MNTSTFRSYLEASRDAGLAFILPGGKTVPAHAHITEIGRVEKRFLDCGGTLRHSVTTSLQAWVAEDLDHRLSAGKLAAIFDRASEIFGDNENPEVELEFEDGLISQYPVISAAVADGTIVFRLGSKHTDCLAREVCLPATSECCTAGSGCC
jgi:hypothetical protein